ncbi:hypothetical protein PAXRUDRAFT_168656 [Paxillus rubicundulus Ve08.2h10]|uniref:DNA 3'-5' helicase n=1 Tax=Paxillus rubicundulus Ve08.2h10 TaxID=930991 RepID=A0A0D0C0L1_9AGAM|nr:hypothetical protein PAXRUDRAFT_168656 [Paxillus rubicundulus Ve08.2h10]
MVLPTPNQACAAASHPTLTEIWQRALKKFGVRPCLWQLKVAEGLLKGDKDVVCTAGTGMGKTLSFWLPLLFRPEGIQIVVTPLNMLGKQNAASLARAGIQAIAINSETSTLSNFMYWVIIVSPEQLMKANGDFKKQLKNTLFASRIISVVIDKAHCLTDWGDFRPEYKELQRLRYILLDTIPIMITSATLTKDTLSNALQLLHMHRDKLTTICRSSDCPNLKIGVRKIKYALNSYADLAFLIPTGWKIGDPLPPKFLIFFDDIQDAINAA